MPVSLLPALSGDDIERVRAMGDQSFADLLTHGELRISSISTREISVEWDHMGLLLRELLRADLDGDGIEDILCECHSWTVQGTFGYGQTILLSRRQSTAKFSHKEA